MIVDAGSMPHISVFPKHLSSAISIFHNCTTARGPENREMSIDWIKFGLQKPGKTKVGLAAALGRSPSMVSDLLAGRRRLRADEIPLVSAYLEIEPPLATQRLIPIVGFVGAGAATVLFSDGQGPFDEVEAPDGSNKDTVAVQIKGESLGALFDSWLVFYDDVHDPPGGRQINRLCVCGLADGRILVKKLTLGQLPGHFTLLSNVEPPIYDVIVEWAAEVKTMVPR